MFDNRLFEEQLRKLKITFADAAKELGISRSTLWRKRTKQSEFKASEVEKLVNLVGSKVFYN